MSKDIIVLTPAGRRQKVHVNADTTILQILEDVCTKQGFQATQYDLKHHRKIMDLTTTVRFSNLPNKAMLEMVESERERTEENVTVGLQLEDGERRTADFPPNTCLYDLLNSLAPNETNSLPQPTIMYMRQEVIGISALRVKTLRQLGLIKGRAVLRLLNKTNDAQQANVSSVYRRPINTKEELDNSTSQKEKIRTKNASPVEAEMAGPSNFPKDPKQFNPIQAIKDIKEPKQQPDTNNQETKSLVTTSADVPREPPVKTETKPLDRSGGIRIKDSTSNSSLESKSQLERRLKIEEEVTFLGDQKALAFIPTASQESSQSDLPDDFYELSVEEVGKLYHDLQQNRIALENTPLMISSLRQEVDRQASELRLASYKNVVVRIQFPDQVILQGIFVPSNTIEDIMTFIKQYLISPETPFHIFTTPMKESLDPKITLSQAQFVPCVHLHFKWLNDTKSQICLKKEVYEQLTSSDAASILASKYRAPSRRKQNEPSGSSTKQASQGNSSKMPKWFKT